MTKFLFISGYYAIFHMLLVIIFGNPGFKMLREAGLLAEDNSIIAAIFSPALMQVITSENPEDITCFPTLEPTAKEAPK